MIQLIRSHRKACSCLYSLLTFQLAADTPTQASLGHDDLTPDPTVGDLEPHTASSVQLGTTRLRSFNSGRAKITPAGKPAPVRRTLQKVQGEESESESQHNASNVEHDSNEGLIQSPGIREPHATGMS